MRDSIHPSQLSRRPQARLLALATLASGLLVAGCGGGSSRPAAATVAGAGTSASSVVARRGSGSSAPDALAFAKCMRAHGVPNFPDPSPGGGFAFHASPAVISSPAFRAAQAKCANFMPGLGGVGGGDFSPQQKAHALAQLRQVAQCMRRHGISDFPDPRFTRPPNLSLGEFSEITNYEGVWLLFPAAIDMRSPAWERAAAACGSLAESFNHAHH